MVRKTSYVNGLSQYFLNNVVQVEDNSIGQAYAKAMMQDLKNTFPNEDNQVIANYLFAWNSKSKKPFTNDFLLELLKVEPKKKKRVAKPGDETFAIRLFGDGDDFHR